jgi:hypothetical protein
MPESGASTAARSSVTVFAPMFYIGTAPMDGRTGGPRSDPVVASIERVLRTERDGVELLRKSRSDAERLLSEARAQAAGLARRADRCIAKLHGAYLEKVEREIAALSEQSWPGARAGRSYDAAALNAAAQRLAAKLTGGA